MPNNSQSQLNQVMSYQPNTTCGYNQQMNSYQNYQARLYEVIDFQNDTQERKSNKRDFLNQNGYCVNLSKINIQKDEQENKVQKEKKKNKRNNNIPKFIWRIFIKHFKAYSRKFTTKDTQIIEVFDTHKTLIHEFECKAINNITLQNLASLFCSNLTDSILNASTAKYNRRTIERIIQMQLRNEIILNNHLCQKETYLNALKTFRLRSRCESLAARIQSQ